MAGMPFGTTHPEKADLNQYWYSAKTIAAINAEVSAQGGSCGFLSTPSLFFAAPPTERVHHAVFDLDEAFAAEEALGGGRYYKYDYRHPELRPSALQHTFDVVVIDPPFITREVWELYAQAARWLLKDGGKVIATTVYENADLLAELLDVRRQVFLPSIPHLVYQYSIYCNFPTTVLAAPNPEIPE